MVSSPSGHHVYLVMPMLDSSNAARTYRLTIYEYIVDIKLLDRRGDRAVLSQVLYDSAPFPTQTSTNYGAVRVSTSGRNLLVQQSKYDEIQWYTLCAYDQKPSLTDPTKCEYLENGSLPEGGPDQMVVMDPFYPDFVFPCSKRTDKDFRTMGKNAQEKIDFVCAIHGQGSKKDYIIFVVTASVAILALVAICGCTVWSCIK